MSDVSFAAPASDFSHDISARPSEDRRRALVRVLAAYTRACKAWLPRLRTAAAQSEGVVVAMAEVGLGLTSPRTNKVFASAHQAVAQALTEALRQDSDRTFTRHLEHGLARARTAFEHALENLPSDEADQVGVTLENTTRDGLLERLGSVLLAFAYQVEAVGRWRRYGVRLQTHTPNTLEEDDLVEVDDGGPRLVRVCFITADEGRPRALFAGFVDPRWEDAARKQALALHPHGLRSLEVGAIDAYPALAHAS